MITLFIVQNSLRVPLSFKFTFDHRYLSADPLPDASEEVRPLLLLATDFNHSPAVTKVTTFRQRRCVNTVEKKTQAFFNVVRTL